MKWHNSEEFKIQDGNYAVDLIGYECGDVMTTRARLRQMIHTTPGQKYKISLYAAAPRVSIFAVRGGGGDCLLPYIRTFLITVGDTNYSVPVTTSVITHMAWEEHAIVFEAASNQTEIGFEPFDPPPAGFWHILIDNIYCEESMATATATATKPVSLKCLIFIFGTNLTSSLRKLASVALEA